MIETKDTDKEQVLNDMEILRIMDARNSDLGKSSMLNDSSMTTERLASLIFSTTTEGNTGPIQRFRDYCLTNCVNRKVVLHDLHLGIAAARVLVSIMKINKHIA
jgi:hypothetical protein